MRTNRIDEARLTVVTRSFIAESPIEDCSAQAMRSARVPIITRVVARNPALPEDVVLHKASVSQQDPPSPGDPVKGLVWALAFEGAAALAIWAIWHLINVLRLRA